LALASLAETENHIAAVALREAVFARLLRDQALNLLRRKFRRTPAVVADEVQMIRLADDRFVVRHAAEFRLPYESRRQQDFQGSINGGESDAMAAGQQTVADLLYGRVAFRFQQRAPDERPLRRLFEVLLCEQFV